MPLVVGDARFSDGGTILVGLLEEDLLGSEEKAGNHHGDFTPTFQSSTCARCHSLVGGESWG
jgi:hypothetical protein